MNNIEQNKRHILWFEYDLTNEHLELLKNSVEYGYDKQNGMLIMYVENDTTKLTYVNGSLATTDLDEGVKKLQDLGKNYYLRYSFKLDNIVSIIPMYKFEYDIMVKNMKENVKPNFAFSPILLLSSRLPGNLEVVEIGWISKECLWDPADGKCDCNFDDGGYYEYIVFERDDYFKDHTKLTPKIEIDLRRNENRLYEIVKPMYNENKDWELNVETELGEHPISDKKLYVTKRIQSQEDVDNFSYNDIICIGKIGDCITQRKYKELKDKGYPVYDFLVNADISTYKFYYKEEIESKTHRLINIHSIY